MKKTNYSHKTKKLYCDLAVTNDNYLSWLEYKKLNKIVRYYPTFNMFMTYRYYCAINNILSQGAGTDEQTAYESLLCFLSERLSQ